MLQVFKEFVLARLGEELEKRLHENREFLEQTKLLREAGNAFKSGCGMGKEGWKLYDDLEEEYTKYNCLYSEEAYKLGFEDAVEVAAEHQLKTKKSVLKAKDMEYMVCLYDAAKKLETVLLGQGEVCHGEGGILKDFEKIFQVIASGTCSEITMLSQDEAMERIEGILENKEMSTEEKAGILSGVQEMDYKE